MNPADVAIAAETVSTQNYYLNLSGVGVGITRGENSGVTGGEEYRLYGRGGAGGAGDITRRRRKAVG